MGPAGRCLDLEREVEATSRQVGDRGQNKASLPGPCASDLAAKISVLRQELTRLISQVDSLSERLT